MRGLALLILMSCEAMESPGSPLDPVAVDTIAPVPTGDSTLPSPAESSTVSDSTGHSPGLEANTEDEVALPTTDMAASSTNSSPQDGSADPGRSLPPTDATAVDGTPPTPLDIDSIEACLAPRPGTSPEVNLGGALRLRRTLSEGGRPVAFVELPDGTAIVAQVGSMFPEQGVVVMSIGDQQIQVAQISPSLHGPEATLLIQTLTSQD